MDISGPLRQLLHQHLPPQASDPFLYVARHVAFSGETFPAIPELLPRERPAHQHLMTSLLLRALPRVHRDARDTLANTLSQHLQKYVTANQRLFFARGVDPVDQLWLYWLLVLARQRLRFTVAPAQLKVLWQNAWSRQQPDGRLHPLSPDAASDTTLYNDLVALHIAYNAVLFTRDFDLFPPVQKLADFHVQSTQPDHITTEPWGLSAFAALDATNTFAPQQLHDATTQLNLPHDHGIILGLLADALMSQDETADL